MENENGFIINPKYKPLVEIENHVINTEPMTYRDSLHYAYLALCKYEMNEEIKKQVIAHLRMIFLRDII